MRDFCLGILFVVVVMVVGNLRDGTTANEALDDIGPCFGRIVIKGYYSPFGKTLTVTCEIKKDLVVNNE